MFIETFFQPVAPVAKRNANMPLLGVLRFRYSVIHQLNQLDWHYPVATQRCGSTEVRRLLGRD